LPVSVLLADDSELIRRTIRRTLDNEVEIIVIAEATNFSETVLLTERLRPDVILLDLHMQDEPGVNALSISQELVSAGSRIVGISVYVDEETKWLAHRIGAAKLLDKMSLGTELAPTLLQLMR
jgi:DNA-binding NarL/FixJ family response regulator